MCLKEVIKWLVPTRIPPPWLELGLNPLGPAFRVQSTSSGAAADATGPRPPEEEEAGPAEPVEPSLEFLKVVAGNRELDISRVKLAKIPSPTGSR